MRHSNIAQRVDVGSASVDIRQSPLLTDLCFFLCSFCLFICYTVATWTTSQLTRRLPKMAISVHSVSANTVTFQLTVSHVVGCFSDFLIYLLITSRGVFLAVELLCN